MLDEEKTKTCVVIAPPDGKILYREWKEIEWLQQRKVVKCQ